MQEMKLYKTFYVQCGNIYIVDTSTGCVLSAHHQSQALCVKLRERRAARVTARPFLTPV